MSLQTVKTLRQIRELLKNQGTTTTQELFWTRHQNGENNTSEFRPFQDGFRYTFLSGTIFHTTGTDTYFGVYRGEIFPTYPIFWQKIAAAEATGTYEIDLKGGTLLVDNQHYVYLTGGAAYRSAIQWLRTPY